MLRERGKPTNVVCWCPWCEDAHWHGAAGGSGQRAPHCSDVSASPLKRTGYVLNVRGESTSERAVYPEGLFVGRRRFHQVVDQAAGALRAVLLRFMLDLRTVRGPVLHRRRPEGSVWVLGPEHWRIEPHGRCAVEGQGFLRFAAALYGCPPGVAAVRLLEGVSFDRLDTRAALEVQSAVDAWIARGAPSRPDL